MNTENKIDKDLSSLSDSKYAHWLYNICKCSNADDMRGTQRAAIKNIRQLTVYVKGAIIELERLKSNLSGNKENIEQMECDILSNTKRLCEAYCSCDEEPMAFLRFINTIINETDRTILRRRYFEGLKWGEISELFGIPVSTLEKKNRKYIKNYRKWKDDESRRSRPS